MKIAKIVLLIAILVSLEAKEYKYKKLKKLYQYPASAFNLKENIIAMEIRSYYISKNQKKYSVEVDIYKTPLKLLDTKLRRRFQNSKPNLSKSGNIHRVPEEPNYIRNAFTIDRDGGILRMNEIVDVASFLGRVDTPAEAQLILWLHSKKSGTEYRKNKKGYEVIIKYEKSYPSSRGPFCSDGRVITDRAIINHKGNIISYKQIHKSKLREGTCLHPSPPIANTE